MKLLIPIALALLSAACGSRQVIPTAAGGHCNGCAWQCATCTGSKYVLVLSTSTGVTPTPPTFPVPQGEEFSWRTSSTPRVTDSPLNVTFTGVNPCDASTFDPRGGCQVPAAASPGTYSYQVTVNGGPNATGIIQVTAK